MMFFGVLKSGETTNVGEEAATVAAKDSIPIRLYNFIAEKKKRRNRKIQKDTDIIVLNTKL